MKILMLCSGGDGAGMNRFMFDLYSKFKGQLYFALAGFKGLVDNQIFPFSEVADKSKKNAAGTVIKSSRCPEFKQRKYFRMALENVKGYDCVVIIGGNGSERGAKELYENGVNTIFVPGTIDNDVCDCAYSIGFSTAVKEAVYAVKNSMTSILSMGSACLFEVMGRECDAIAKATAQQVNADYCICQRRDLNYEKMKNIILQNHVQGKSACIIVRENILPLGEIASKLNELCGDGLVKEHIVGRTQRGGKPTEKELQMAKKYAQEVISCIKNKVFGVRVLCDAEENIFIDEFKNYTSAKQQPKIS